MQKILVHACFSLVMLVCGAALVSAHGSSFSFEETKDGYLIDIGYDEFIAADESVRFDFAIYPEDIEAVEIEGDLFTDVWITITQDKKAYFAGGIDKPAFGATGFTYAFPKEGEYVLTARFQKDGETVVATELPLSIIEPLETKKELPSFVLPLLAALAGLCIGFAGGLFIPKK